MLPYYNRFSLPLGGSIPFDGSEYYPERLMLDFLVHGLDDISAYTAHSRLAYFSILEFTTFCPVFGRCGGGVLGGFKVPVSEKKEVRIGARLGFSPIYYSLDMTPHIVFLHYFKQSNWFFGVGTNIHFMFLDSLNDICVFVYIKFGL